MKRTFIFLGVLAALLISSFGLTPSAFASVTPTLSLSATGSGDNVQINVMGDPNVSVLLSYYQTGVGSTITSLGSTNANGSFSTDISSAGYDIASGTAVTVILNGTSGPRSNSVAWPTVTSATALTVSPSAAVISVGSSVTVTATNVGSGSLYVSNNSNSSIANVNINGSQVTFTGNIAGTTSVTLCAVGKTTNCPSVYVMVQSSGSGQLSLSQTNVSVVSGQNLPVTISGGNGIYQILNNSNPGVIQASLNGSVLTVSTGATTGSSSIALCSTDRGACGVVTATAGSSSSVSVSFSNSAPVVSTAQGTTVNIYGPSGVQFYVSSNSNPSVVQANLSGTTLTLTGIVAGTSSISVCASTGTCSSFTATVQYVATGANITLSQTALSLLAGQNGTITVSGGQQPYTVSGGTSSVSQQTLTNNTLNVYGIAAGTSTVNVCSAGGGCVVLTITVNGSGSGSTTFTMSPSTLALTIGQNSTVYLYGGSSFYVSGNTGPTIASVAINGSTATVTGLSAGSMNATICLTGGTCSTLYVTVNALSSTPSGTTTGTGGYVFTKYLAQGSEGAEVLALQKALVAGGYLKATPNSYFGLQTKAAVIKYQNAHGLTPLGVVGPTTRAVLNTGSTTSTGGTAGTMDISTMTLSQLKAEVLSLQSRLTQALSRMAQLTGN